MHTHTHSSMIHVIKRMFSVNPQEAQRRKGTTQVVQWQTISINLISLRCPSLISLSHGISHLNVHRRKNLRRTMQHKEILFSILDHLGYCRLYCCRAVWLCIIEDKQKKKRCTTMVKKCFPWLNVIQIGYRLYPLGGIFIHSDLQSASREVLSVILLHSDT